MSDELPDGIEGTIGSEHLGVRVWSMRGATMQELIDQIAMVLGEHMADGDELHVSYSSMQAGQELRERGHLLRAAEQWTETLLEYSALVVLRSRAG